MGFPANEDPDWWNWGTVIGMGEPQFKAQKVCALYFHQAPWRKVGPVLTSMINAQEWNCAKKGLCPRSLTDWAVWYGWSVCKLGLRNSGKEKEKEWYPKAGCTPRSWNKNKEKSSSQWPHGGGHLLRVICVNISLFQGSLSAKVMRWLDPGMKMPCQEFAWFFILLSWSSGHWGG